MTFGYFFKAFGDFGDDDELYGYILFFLINGE